MVGSLMKLEEQALLHASGDFFQMWFFVLVNGTVTIDLRFRRIREAALARIEVRVDSIYNRSSRWSFQ